MRNLKLSKISLLVGLGFSMVLLTNTAQAQDRKFTGAATTMITDGNGQSCPAKFSSITGSAGYPFDTPDISTLIAKPIRDGYCYRNSFTGWEWSSGYALYQNDKLFAVSYSGTDSQPTNSKEIDELKAYGLQFCSKDYYRCYVFADKEVWGLKWENPRLNPYKLRGTDEFEARKKKEAEEAELRAKQEQEAYDRKVANFRKNLKVGDDATAGMVIEIKGDLIKIQTNDSQCSQKDYNGKCMNYVNTPVEKWVKRRELYPAD